MTSIRKIVSDWLGTTPFETDRVLMLMDELAEDRGLDLDEATVAQIRKLADLAYDIYDNHPEYQGFAYKLEG